jgi:hypothetical protein
MKKIFGREPAVFFALLAGILLALIKFTTVPEDVAGALNAAVLAGAGFATAATVSAERALPALVGLVQATFAVFLSYGSPVPESTQTGILALIAAVGAAFVRGNVLAPVTPLGDTVQEATAAAYEHGYQAGQDDMVPDPDAKPERVRFARPQETGTHGHTEVLPAVGDIYKPDND